MGSMGSPSARFAEVATRVMGIEVNDVLIGGAFGDAGASVGGGGSGGSVELEGSEVT